MTPTSTKNSNTKKRNITITGTQALRIIQQQRTANQFTYQARIMAWDFTSPYCSYLFYLWSWLSSWPPY